MANRQIFNGGSLQLQILNAEKYGGTDKIFGKGKYVSYIRVISGNREVGRSIVENGKVLYVDKKTIWGGYDSNFKLMKISPTLKPSVKLFIYDCDRENENAILGEAKLKLQDAISPANEPTTLTLDIITKNHDDRDVAIGTIVLSALFHPNPISLYQLSDKISLNTATRSPRFFFGVGWDDDFTLPGYTDQSFGASLAIFNAEGNLIESIYLPQWKEKKSLQSLYTRIKPVAEDGYTTDKLKISFNLESHLNPNNPATVFAASLVLSSLNDFQTLQPLQNVYCRLVDERSNLEIGRYCLKSFENPVSSCMLMRLQRDASQSSPEELKWCVTPQFLLDYTTRSCGPLLPLLKANLAELFATPQAEDEEGTPAPAPPAPIVLKPSDRIGYVHTTEQTYLLESFYEVSAEEMVSSFSGEVTFGIRWEEAHYPPGRVSSQIDMDLAAIVLDSKYNVLDRIAGAGVPIPPKPPRAPPAPPAAKARGGGEGEDGEGEEGDEEEEETAPEPEPEEEEEEAISAPPVSSNGSLLHGGEIPAERVEDADDHFIQIKLKGVEEHPDATYLALYSSSLSGKSFQENHLVGLSAHLFDSASQQELLSYEITDTSEFSKDTFFTSSETSTGSGVLLAVLFLFEGKWYAMSSLRPLTGCPPAPTLASVTDTITAYLNETKPLSLQLRLNTHNSTQVKRYGHLTR